MSKKIVILFFILIHFRISAQKVEQDIRLLTYNVGFNGLTAGIGAIINKDNEHKWYQRFARGFSKGCLGGAIMYTGKKIIFPVNNQKNYFYAWPSKILFHAGTSIVESASLNRPFGKYWNFDLWGFRYDFSIGENSHFKVRFLTSTIYSVLTLSKFARFDLARSLKSGILFFSTDNMVNKALAITELKVIGVRTNFSPTPEYHEHMFTAHEIIHTYQYREYEIFNTWFKPTENCLPNFMKNVLSKYIYLDMPYNIGFYAMQPHDRYNYYGNFYEMEAQHFATNKYVNTNKKK